MLVALALLLLAIPVEPSPPDEVSLPADAAEGVRFDLLKYRDRVESDGSQVRVMDVRVRLGSAQGVAQFGQIGLPYVDGFGDVLFEDVAIEKGDGRRVEVKNGLVEDLNPFGVSGTSLPADVRFKRLTIPGLEPGDSLSYRVVTRRKPLVPGRVFGEMKIPPTPGSVLQAYELDLPRQGAIRVRLRDGLGAAWEEVPATPDRLVRRIALRVQLPDGKRKLSKAERQDWIEPDVSFTSFGSWSEMSSWWWELSKDRLKPDASVAREAESLAAAAGSPREKLAALHAFLATRIRYLNVSFGLGRMQPRAAADVLQNRYGDCKDKHALLAALAASLGLDVRPVLISSERDELRDDVPGPQQFDHMVSVARLGPAPSEWLWLDGTNPFGGPGYLLPQLRDKRALLVEADGGAVLVRTPKDPPFLPRQEASFKGALDPDGLLRGRVTWRLRSDEGVQLRGLFSLVPQERRVSAVKELMARDWEEATISNVSVSDPLEAAPLRVEFDVEKKLPGKGPERGLWVPFPEFELPEADGTAPAGEPAVSFDLRELSARAEIELPEGQRARLPLSVSLERPFGSFRSAYALEGRTLKLERTLTLSQPSLAEADLAAYASFRNAVATDRKQEFAIEGAAPAAPTAESLHSQGLAAFEKKDYARAVELLRQATEADPKVKDGFHELGRALHELRRSEEALAAFTRQIELTPFHESAYAWRSFELQRLERWDEAEKDLLKQIEVAPFKAWSYEKLGERRLLQLRYGEAADYFERAAAIEPKEPERWLDLGDAQARAARPEEARKALERAVALEPPDWVKVRAGSVYRTLGDLSRAGELAQAALPSLGKRLAGMTAADLDEADLYWGERLVEAWSLVGEAAEAAGDHARAERYLEAAWRSAFSARAGWALGEQREKQGRLAEAVELWSMAASVPSAGWSLPSDRQARIQAACRKLPAVAAFPAPTALREVAPPKPARQEAAEARLMELRTVRLTGPVAADLTAEVLLLADATGRVERIAAASPAKAAAVDRQVVKLGPARLSWPRPDEQPFKMVRRGLLACNSSTGCALVLDLPGLAVLAEATADLQKHSRDLGSVSIVDLEPPDTVELVPGQAVTIKARVRYTLEAQEGRLTLVVQSQGVRSVVSSRPEPVKRGTGEATLTATFTVPEGATGIDVLVPLGRSDGGVTPTVASARYVVTAPQAP